MTQPQESKVEVDAYTVREAAAIFGVTTSAIYLWMEQGKLAEATTLGGGVRLVTAKSIERYKRERQEAK